MISIGRVSAMARKEVAHITRDPFTVIMALGMPMMIVLIFGTAFEFNLDHMPLAIFDSDKTAESRQVAEAFGSSGHFVPRVVDSSTQALRDLDAGRAQAALLIPPGFATSFGGSGSTAVQILVDGADSTAAGSILSYLPMVQAEANKRLVGKLPLPSIELVPRFHFNPELSTRWFMVPGLGVVIIAILSILLTSLTVAREWENGSMELLLSTPVRPFEIIVGKLAPYLVLGLGGVVFVYVSARLVFGVPFRGSHALYFLGCALFVTTCMAQGLLISSVTRAQQIAMQATMISGLLPTIYLSGFMFPIEHMPAFFQYLTSILAPRWFMKISHSLYLKGSDFVELARPFATLTGICCLLLFVAARTFKRDVEP
jgi:ABC-2 type transport system permease protein